MSQAEAPCEAHITAAGAGAGALTVKTSYVCFIFIVTSLFILPHTLSTYMDSYTLVQVFCPKDYLPV